MCILVKIFKKRGLETCDFMKYNILNNVYNFRLRSMDTAKSYGKLEMLENEVWF
jgi:hypothetical protein